MNKRMRRNVLFYAATAVFITAMFLSAVLTVYGRNREEGVRTESYYREREQELVSEVRRYLNESGYTNSGITFTRVVDGEGGRAYTITIHHRRIDNMEPEERAALAGRLAQFAFAEEGCTFSCRFLITNE